MQIIFTSVTRALRNPRPLKAQPTQTISRQLSTTTVKMGSTSTAPATKGNADNFLSLIKERRSIYPLNKELPIDTARVQNIITESLQHVPSSFNSQSNRALVLFGVEHEKFWDIATEVLRAIVPADAWESTGQKMTMFKAAAGTALFFEDQTAVEGLQARFPAYADRYVHIISSHSLCLAFPSTRT